MAEPRRTVRTTVNGRSVEADVPVRLSLADWLRDELLLKGTHLGCEHGVCGCCNVLLDGEDVRSCLLLAVQVDGHEVTTVEGLAVDGHPSALQEAFCNHHALQCGYCTAGMLISGTKLLEANPDPSAEDIETALGGNLCRCTGYDQIREAVRAAARPTGPVGGASA